MKPKNSLKWSGIKLSGEWPIWPKPTATLENTKMYQNYFLNEIICLKWPNSAQFMETFNMFYVDITLWFWLRDIFIMQIRKIVFSVKQSLNWENLKFWPSIKNRNCDHEEATYSNICKRQIVLESFLFP